MSASEPVAVAVPSFAPTVTPSARVENAIARDMAAGVPTREIVKLHRLGSLAALEQLLNQSHMPALIEAQKHLFFHAAKITYAKMLMAAPAVVDNIIAMASDLEHPECTKNAHYIIDRIVPKQPVQLEVTHRVDEGVMKEFSEAFTQLRNVGHLNALPIIDVTNDPHLRSGTEVILERDQASQAVPVPTAAIE